MKTYIIINKLDPQIPDGWADTVQGIIDDAGGEARVINVTEKRIRANCDDDTAQAIRDALPDATVFHNG